MSLSDLQKLLSLAETDTSLKAEFKAIGEALEADAAEPDDANLNAVYEKFISLAASKNLNVVLDDFEELDAQTSEDESQEEVSEGVELSDEDLEAVAGGRRVAAGRGRGRGRNRRGRNNRGGGGNGGNNAANIGNATIAVTVMASSDALCSGY